MTLCGHKPGRSTISPLNYKDEETENQTDFKICSTGESLQQMTVETGLGAQSCMAAKAKPVCIRSSVPTVSWHTKSNVHPHPLHDCSEYEDVKVRVGGMPSDDSFLTPSPQTGTRESCWQAATAALGSCVSWILDSLTLIFLGPFKTYEAIYAVVKKEKEKKI